MITLSLWLPTKKLRPINKHFIQWFGMFTKTVGWEIECFYSGWRQLFILDFHIILRGHRGVWFSLGLLGIEFGWAIYGQDNDHRELMGK